MSTTSFDSPVLLNNNNIDFPAVSIIQVTFIEQAYIRPIYHATLLIILLIEQVAHFGLEHSVRQIPLDKIGVERLFHHQARDVYSLTTKP